MRRSQAPSMRRNNENSFEIESNGNTTRAPSPTLAWGTSEYESSRRTTSSSSSPPIAWGTSESLVRYSRPLPYKATENPLQNKRIFCCCWRYMSTKKHKTWRGEGTLELTPRCVTIKDDYGKCIGTLNCFKAEQIVEGSELEVGTVEVLVQEELKTEEECVSQRKREISNWYTKQESYDDKFRYNLSQPQKLNILKASKPIEMQGDQVFAETVVKRKCEESNYQVGDSKDWSSNASTSIRCTSKSISRYSTQCFCILQSSELQEQLIKHCDDYSLRFPSDVKVIKEIALQICDHPALLSINESLAQLPDLMELLLQPLPPLNEMQIYDSAKFEFVTTMVENLTVVHGEHCAVIADNRAILDIILGYCQHHALEYVKIDSENMDKVTHFNIPHQSPRIALMQTDLAPLKSLIYCRHIIAYNLNALDVAYRLISDQNAARIYIPITGGSIEEQQLDEHIQCECKTSIQEQKKPKLEDQQEVAENHLLSWTTFKPPFDSQLLEQYFLHTDNGMNAGINAIILKKFTSSFDHEN